MDKNEFSRRVEQLRKNKGVSARDMSLSLGQSPVYINSIENAVNYPSMTVFFYICEYLGITPAEFFETDSVNPSKETELAQAVRGLSNQQLDTLITLAKGLKK